MRSSRADRAWLARVLLGSALTLAGCDRGEPLESASVSSPEVEVVSWDALMPPDWSPEDYLDRLQAQGIDDMGDEDPRAVALMEALKAEWAKAPIVPALEGRRVRLAGFVVPLAWEDQVMTEFLLVPYFGACIHVPPPPASQTVHVVLPAGAPYRGGLFDTLWVTGTMHISTTENDLAAAGYRIDAERVEPYEGDIETE